MHIRKGCLSNIPAGNGTNRNENLHKILNKSMLAGASRIGPELAHAILTILFYQYNMRLKGFTSVPSSIMNAVKSGTHQLLNLSNHFPAAKNAVGTAADVTSQDNRPNVDLEIVNSIVIHSKYLYESIKKMVKFSSKTFDPSVLYFTTGFTPVSIPKTNDEESTHSQRLQCSLATHNRQIVPMAKNGNCAFLSVAHALSNAEEFNSLFVENIMTNTNLNIELLQLNENGIEKFADQLRKEFVQQAYRHVDKYIKSTTFSSKALYMKELSHFEEQGVFSGQIGDMVMSVLADLLQIPIVLLTSIEGLPIIQIIPDIICLHYQLYIAYNQYGPGHYDATIAQPDLPKVKPECNSPLLSVAGSSCRCGTNKPKGEQDPSELLVVCTNTAARKTRCPCYKAGLDCNQMCKCVNCGNGKSDQIESKMLHSELGLGSKRRRKSSYLKQTSEKFLTENDLSVIAGPYTLNEHCVIQSIICYILANNLKREVLFSGTYIHKLYNSVSSVMGDSSIRPKSLRSIETVLRELRKRKHLADLFST